MAIARVVKCVSALGATPATFQVEVRNEFGAASRWPARYEDYDEALAAARAAGVEVLLGWREEHVCAPGVTISP